PAMPAQRRADAGPWLFVLLSGLGGVIYPRAGANRSSPRSFSTKQGVVFTVVEPRRRPAEWRPVLCLRCRPVGFTDTLTPTALRNRCRPNVPRCVSKNIRPHIFGLPIRRRC